MSKNQTTPPEYQLLSRLWHLPGDLEAWDALSGLTASRMQHGRLPTFAYSVIDAGRIIMIGAKLVISQLLRWLWQPRS